MNVDQIIDKKTVAIPGPIGDVTPAVRQARDEAVTARDEAERFASTVETVQDGVVSGFIADGSSATRTALDDVMSNRGVALGHATILCIGDSFGDWNASDHGAWTTELRSLLPDASLQVMCSSGSGFWREYGVNFQNQIKNAKTAGVKPDVIIVAGGVNDTDAPLSELSDRVAATLREATIGFPAVPVVLFPMMAGYWHLTLKRRMVAHVIMGIAARMGIPFLRGMWWWNAGRRENVTVDDLHPTGTGANLLAKIMLAYLRGHEILPLSGIVETVWNNTGTVRHWVSAGVAHVSWQGMVSDTAAFEKRLALPDSLASTATEKQVSGYTASGTSPLMGTFEIADNTDGMKFVITSPIVAGQMQIMLTYEI